MGVACRIFINKPKGVFYSGQLVSGIVRHAIDKPTKYRAITLSLFGTGKCRWSESDEDGDFIYHKGSEDYVNLTIDLLKHTGSPVNLQKGVYDYPFQFYLPENIPSSYNTKKCTIKYLIQIQFEKNNLLSFDKKYKAEIPVYELIQPAKEPVLFQKEKTIFKLFSFKKHEIDIRGAMAKSCVYPGENINIQMIVKNDTNEHPRINVSLHATTILKSSRNKKHKTRVKIEDCNAVSSEIPSRSQVNFSLTVPTKPDLYTINTKILKKEYMLKIKLRLPVPHRNAVIKVPVVIGVRRGLERVMVTQEPLWELMMAE